MTHRAAIVPNEISNAGIGVDRCLIEKLSSDAEDRSLPSWRDFLLVHYAPS